ncbi:cytochrome P450 [Trametes cingulata]|nr:cytochrome P450 [Trametes cingulata]
MEDASISLSFWVSVAAGIVVLYFVKWRLDPLHAIPTVGGSSLPILSYFAAREFMHNSRKVLEEGYRKYRGSAFKVPMLDRWVVVVSGAEMVQELKNRPDEELSFQEDVADVGLRIVLTMQLRHIAVSATENPYHVDIIRDKLTRSLPAILPDIFDELCLAIPRYIPAEDPDTWVAVDVLTAMQHIIARASSRAFIGVPMCRHEEYLECAISFTDDLIRDTNMISCFPVFLKPLAVALFSQARRNLAKVASLLMPIIDERRALGRELRDDWSDRPNDFLQWMLDSPGNRGETAEETTSRMMLLNFAAIHTSSNSITLTLYSLLDHPECIQELREEIESVVEEQGWTKAAVGRMWKLDSILKEYQRFKGLGLASMGRKAMKDVTLRDGTFIPRGASVFAASYATHHDDDLYPDPDVFDPFRFSRMRERDREGVKHQFVNTSLDYIAFGHGRHACPGRFFAANELKLVLAYILLNYDFKLKEEGTGWSPRYWGMAVVPFSDLKIMFRKRERVGLSV